MWAVEQLWCRFLTDFNTYFIQRSSTYQSITRSFHIPVPQQCKEQHVQPVRVISVHCFIVLSPKTELKAGLEVK